MKHFLTGGAFALAAIGLATSASAQDYEKPKKPQVAKDLWFHVDANVALMQFSETEGDTEFVSDNVTAGYIRAGVKYKYFGAEVELGTGFSDYEEDGISLGVNNQTAVWGMLRLPQDRSDIFLRVGAHTTDIELGVDGGPSIEDSDSGIAFGLGGNYYFSRNVGVRLDLTSYNLGNSDEFGDILDVNYIGGSIGLSARF